MVWVKNSVGTKDQHTSHGWLNWWKKQKHKENQKVNCAVCEHKGKQIEATDGAHVETTDFNTLKEHYIIPTCHPCNMSTAEKFFVKKDAIVPVNLK